MSMMSPPISMSSPPVSMSSPRPSRSRAQSVSSDRQSVAAHGLLSPPLSIAPDAGFIAASAASQIVTNDHDTHAALWYDQHGLEPSGETAVVTPPALQLVNNFLDQLLLNFLSKARSTSLSALRPAVTEVLKPKLAKDAINQADEELYEYLGGGDEDDLLQQGPESPQDWDLELVWKRTRLRCMVYSSLGDMEEEDEDYHMEREGLELADDEEEVISPAVAIFLTSILEYMGEQTLVVAGQGAYHRLQSRLEKEVKNGTRDPTEPAERVIVDDLDMDRVALDRTMGRLWRAWKKRIRSPTVDSHSRPYSRNSVRPSHFRQNSAIPPFEDTVPETPTAEEAPFGTDDKAAEPLPDELAMASSVPLPIGNRDVDEIEVPGLVSYSEDDEENEQPTVKRAQSMLFTSPVVTSIQAPSTLRRKRSNSAPHLSIASFSRRGHPEAVEGQDAAEPEDLESGPEPDAASPDVAQNGTDNANVASKTTHDERAEAEEEEIGHFEILTTARVSISGGNSPVISESDATMSRSSSSRQAMRPASISSPRLIEVAGPKSPLTRSHSIREAADFPSPPRAADEGHHGPQAVETIFRSPISAPASRSPAERHQQAKGTGVAISELEENVDPHTIPASASMPTPTSANVSPKKSAHALPAKQFHVNAGYPSRHHGPPSPIQEHSHGYSRSGTRVTMLDDADTFGYGQAPPEPQRKQSVPNRSYPPHAQDRAARRPSAQDASDPSAPSRQTHTSGSSVSSGTSRLKPVRTSEDSSGTRPEDVARNFEELIQSDQTIQYTLTPESMRDFDASSLNNSIKPTKSRRSDDIKRINTNRSRSSSNGGSSVRVGNSMETKRTQSGSRQNGQPMPPPSPKPSSFSGPVPRAPKSGSSLNGQGSRGQIQARDPRLARDSMSDFADFIRATGPAKDNGPSPLRNAAPASIASAKDSVDTRRVSTTSSRARLQARDAAVDVRDDHSDLIDFIRRGPSDGAATHRIPRAVAPFRTTMDSDQLAAAPGGKAVDAASFPNYRDSRASGSATDMSPSMPSSINSNTALLKKKPSYQMNETLDEEPPMPQRKTRRIKDPYAIDFSDEEEEEANAPPPKPAKKEESLAEFLMNYEPPPENPPSIPIHPAAQVKKKKSSASNLLGRFRSGTASSRDSAAPSMAPSAKSMPRSTMPRAAPMTRASTAGSGKGYIPLQVNMPPGYDKYGPADRPAPPPKTPSSAGGVPRKKFEPREAMTSSGRSGTSDLAAFLRSSEPPPSGPVRGPYPPIEEEGSSVSRMLGRRKKAAA